MRKITVLKTSRNPKRNKSSRVLSRKTSTVSDTNKIMVTGKQAEKMIEMLSRPKTKKSGRKRAEIITPFSKRRGKQY